MLNSTNEHRDNRDDKNDLFDEFEFKPLTAGLGFHKKTATAATTNTPNINTNFNTSVRTTPTIHQSSTTSTQSFNLQPPLPRNEQNTIRKPALNVPMIEDDSITKAQSAVNEILKTLNQKKQHEDLLAKNIKRLTWVNTSPSLAAGFLDTLLTSALFLISMIAMLAITKIDLIANLNNPDSQFMIYWSTLCLFATIQFIYFITCRAFLGHTPGEWAFDQRCGSEIQQATRTYILKVTARTIINICTGFIVMSFISLVIRKDFLSYITGLQIQKQKYI